VPTSLTQADVPVQSRQLRSGVEVQPSIPRRTGLRLEEVLDGRLGADGIRELVHNPMQHGLANLLAQCVPGREKLSSAKLLRTKYKPGRKLTAYYRLHVGAEVRPIALSWYAESHPDSLAAADMQDQAAPHHLVAPFVRLTARTESGQMGLLIAPIDPQMPQLIRLNEHSHVASMLKNLTSDSAPLAEATRIEALRYRPGQRHVLHVSSPPDRNGAAFIKIDRDNHGVQAVRFAQAVGPLLSEHSPNTCLVTPLGYSVEDQAAVWRGIAGTTISVEVRDPAQATRLLSLIGKAVRTIHDLDCQTTYDMTASQLSAPHLARTELASTLGAGEHLTALMPTLGARYRLLAMEVLERLEDLPEEALQLAHGDLKCDNILTTGDRIWLLDLDRTGLAEPAMDLGKLLADLRWWGLHYSVDVAGLVRKFLEAYGPCDPARISRARLIAVLYQLKLAARRNPVHAPDWGTQVTRQVDEAAASLRETTP
jgi:aminoglycoside phosphotransferase